MAQTRGAAWGMEPDGQAPTRSPPIPVPAGVTPGSGCPWRQQQQSEGSRFPARWEGARAQKTTGGIAQAMNPEIEREAAGAEKPQAENGKPHGQHLSKPVKTSPPRSSRQPHRDGGAGDPCILWVLSHRGGGWRGKEFQPSPGCTRAGISTQLSPEALFPSAYVLINHRPYKTVGF